MGKRKDRFLAGFLTGAGLITSLSLMVVLIFTFFSKPKKPAGVKGNNVIAPYYQDKNFTPPPNLEKNSTGEADIRNMAKMKIPIIMYHYVEYVKDIGDFIRKRLDITPDVFEKELKVLRESGYQTYFVKDIPDIIDGKIMYNSSRSAVLTFDDGYEDFYTVVFPLLKKYQTKATVYIVYDFINRKGFLSDKQIRELVDSDLVEIGSHAMDHISLKALPETVVRRQIVDSKNKLEERFGTRIKTIAYPFGSFDSKTVEIAKQASYSAAVSVISGVEQSEDNLYYLSRIRPGIFTPQNIIKVLEKF
ncbi:polysaccharide deacetylase family protein [Candidatus Roizmanbacteria bacterium]|jgi:peptidoglycan/xylan/chitin deacetylase (PgdA/CDA1 family)|nr:polysaccharide deacetylase family protein [Candidatus Roizmanbacteria bacterium]